MSAYIIKVNYSTKNKEHINLRRAAYLDPAPVKNKETRVRNPSANRVALQCTIRVKKKKY